MTRLKAIISKWLELVNSNSLVILQLFGFACHKKQSYDADIVGREGITVRVQLHQARSEIDLRKTVNSLKVL